MNANVSLCLYYICVFFSEAKKVLPRPKVGDFCSIAMEQGFSDACIPLCMGETNPVPRIAQACRAAAMEMPRPTVRKWCEHGYRSGFQKTVTDLKNHFGKGDPNVFSGFEASANSGEGSNIQPGEPAVVEESRKIVDTIPVTLDDKTIDLHIYEGQTAEDAVAEFCHANVADDASSCIRQLLQVVLERVK